MKIIKCIAIDDNVSALSIIEGLSKKVDFIEVEKIFTNAIEAGTYLKNNKEIDLIFLDVNMPEMDGLTFLKTYKPKQHIIFISKHKEHAVDSYELENSLDIKVIDFLPIPVTIERFIRACNTALDEIIEKEKFIFISENSINFKLAYNDIIYITASGDDSKYMDFHFRQDSVSAKNFKNPMTFRLALKPLAERLPEDLFMQVSKNTIINLDIIVKTKGDLIYTNIPEKKEIEIGDKYRANFQDFIDKYRGK